jgi:hypothetical protein
LGIAKRFLALRRHMVNNLYKNYKGIAMYYLKIPRAPLFGNVFREGQKHSFTIMALSKG